MKHSNFKILVLIIGLSLLFNCREAKNDAENKTESVVENATETSANSVDDPDINKSSYPEYYKNGDFSEDTFYKGLKLDDNATVKYKFTYSGVDAKHIELSIGGKLVDIDGNKTTGVNINYAGRFIARVECAKDDGDWKLEIQEVKLSASGDRKKTSPTSKSAQVYNNTNRIKIMFFSIK